MTEKIKLDYQGQPRGTKTDKEYSVKEMDDQILYETYKNDPSKYMEEINHRHGKDSSTTLPRPTGLGDKIPRPPNQRKRNAWLAKKNTGTPNMDKQNKLKAIQDSKSPEIKILSDYQSYRPDPNVPTLEQYTNEKIKKDKLNSGLSKDFVIQKMREREEL